jgi:hypothetical protein
MSDKGNAQSRRWLSAAAGCATALLASGCGGGETAAAAPETVVVTVPASPSAAAPATSAVPPAPTTPAATAPVDPGVDFAMPAVVGLDLQSAQDTMQQMGVFYSVSHDLLGTRNQVLDSGWIVCDQTPPAGQQVTGNVEGTIDFGVVKRGEPCP